MYNNEITTQAQAVCHLFFHCCLKDGRFTDKEMSAVSSRLVDAGLHKELSVKDEVVKYRNYRGELINEQEYLRFLIDIIKPVNSLALYSYCVELVLSDASLSPEEETLLSRLATVMGITSEQQDAAKTMVAQREVVKTEKIF